MGFNSGFKGLNRFLLSARLHTFYKYTMSVLKALSIVRTALHLFRFASPGNAWKLFQFELILRKLFDTHLSLCNIALSVNSANNRLCNHVCVKVMCYQVLLWGGGWLNEARSEGRLYTAALGARTKTEWFHSCWKSWNLKKIGINMYIEILLLTLKRPN